MTITHEHDHALSYHPPVPGRAELHEDLRAAAKLYCSVLDAILPPSREASLAFTDLQNSLMWANAAVAIHQDRLDLPPARAATASTAPTDFCLSLLCAATAEREVTLELHHQVWTAAFVHVDGRVLTTTFGLDSEVDQSLAKILDISLLLPGTYHGRQGSGPYAEDTDGDLVAIDVHGNEQTTGDAVEMLTGRHPDDNTPGAVARESDGEVEG